MFKICNDKAYYVVQTTSEDVVVEIYTKKDGRGNDINLHEMHLDLCRAIRKLQHDGYTIMKVYLAMGDRRESIDVLSMPEFIQSAISVALQGKQENARDFRCHMRSNAV